MNTHKGFTLLEVLIALSLFGLMLNLVFTALYMAARTWEAGEPQAAALTGRLVVERFLRQQFSQAQTWSGIERVRALEGKPDSLSFTAFLPFHTGVRGPQRFKLALVGQALKVKVTPVQGEVPEAERQLRDLVMLDQVRSVNFRYFMGGEWLDSWEDKNGLPDQVEVVLQTDGGFPWPPMRIRFHHGLAGGRRGHGLGMTPFRF